MTTAVVLTGGGAKGDFQVGALRYLYDPGVRPDVICGTSVGSINALKLAEGENPADPRHGLPGLEAIRSELRSSDHMYPGRAVDSAALARVTPPPVTNARDVG